MFVSIGDILNITNHPLFTRLSYTFLSYFGQMKYFKEKMVALKRKKSSQNDVNQLLNELAAQFRRCLSCLLLHEFAERGVFLEAHSKRNLSY